MRILILGYQGGDIGSWRQSADPFGSTLGAGFKIFRIKFSHPLHHDRQMIIIQAYSLFCLVVYSTYGIYSLEPIPRKIGCLVLTEMWAGKKTRVSHLKLKRCQNNFTMRVQNRIFLKSIYFRNTTMFILNLAFADLLYCVTNIPMYSILVRTYFDIVLYLG